MAFSFDRYAAIIFIVIGACFIFESRKISETAYGSNVGPDIFPMGLGILLILLSLRLLFETRGTSQDKAATGALDYKKFIIIFAAAILYALFLEKLGYVITTFVFLTIGFQVMEKGKWLKSLVIAGGFSFGIYYVFVKVLDGTLPGFPVFF
ncbi:tripartite tricarboxylate transporter TctB family protein [Domibacillus epiphyticus]|uniref:Transporter n=1 Tax=Domibacillus epiphyticus TaxID=1714355 RepID=A0A1V2ABM1_9BACI|nr:tripartite tricarboxylate transporter TctB family protein [Domibacillus epiphyticus]OMP68360.1 transporter [Domibacillus epiphyticus]